MKQAASILLLTILTFNWVGYRFVSGYFESKADQALEATIDNFEYNDDELFELRVPLNTPYVQNSGEFERFSGELEIDGVHYKYVKRKVENGDLVLLCIQNDKKSRFQSARNDFFKLVNDFNNTSHSTEKNSSASVKTIAAEYRQEHNKWTIEPLMSNQLRHIAKDHSYRSEGFIDIPAQPPRA